MTKHIGRIVAVVALAATGLVASGAASAAAPAITLSSPSVQLGKTVTATAAGCQTNERSDGPTFTYRTASLVVITVTPAGERMAAGGAGGDETGQGRSSLTVPGWVDPADPALVAGRCLETSYDIRTGQRSQSVVLTYADVPVDITVGTGARTPVLALSRTTAAGGQVISTSGTGCVGTDYAVAALLRGGNLSGRVPVEFVATTESDDQGTVGPTVVGELTLNDQSSDYDGGGFGQTGGPLDEGDYIAVLACQTYGRTSTTLVFSLPQLVHVVGTNPSGSLMVRSTDDGQVEVSGEGCASGQPVAVHVDGYRYGSPFLSGLNDQAAAMAVGNRSDALAPIDDGEDVTFSFDETVTPAADGTWTYTFDQPNDSFELSATADCGDPTVDGFRYSPRYLSEDHTAEIDLSRISPTSSPVGGQVTAHGDAYCGIDRNDIGSTDEPVDGTDHVLTIQLVDRTGAVLSESPALLSEQYGFVTGTVTAPTTPGDYFLVGTCDGERGYPTPYTVFTPTTLAQAGPSAAEPTTGWPRDGAPETYDGRIGPITLPAMDMGGHMGTDAMGMDDGVDMGDGVAHAASGSVSATTAPAPPLPPDGLGPSGLFIDVPRPAGDFAITKLSVDLVDAQGNSVGADMAHLHHFVIGNASGVNPACPNGTFGIPGEIVAAAGAERTVLDTGDGPYGIMVKGSDDWKGVYMLMSRSMTDQQVFLSYDMEYRRDVQNVRPLTSYFGSATGCSTYTWAVDGSGTPDVQSHYVTLAKDGLMVGAGAHFHNGGSYADLTDDRGRRLCRSVMTLKDETVGMGHMHDGMQDDGYPPEFYADDHVIDAISNCSLHEQVKAGERLRFDTVYANDRARSGLMGIYTFYVWEGGGPKAPTVLAAERDPGRNPDRATPRGTTTRAATTRAATGARAVSARARYTG